MLPLDHCDLHVGSIINLLLSSVCDHVMQVEEYSTHVEQVGGPDIYHYEYVVEMVIQPQ